ncbi:hypothetical protein G6L37_03725 [Agrobacterium rubi]|nr:hypothetical protein [Agrobacterium rubi]NTF24461.1 hypothetical protein [Agrobacterium rubi]
MLNDYALITPEETVSALSDGMIQGRLAVCVVRDAVAEVHVAWPADVARLTRGLPIVPSVRGQETAHLQFDEEMEAMQAIEDAVRSEVSRLTFGLPPSFMEVQPVLTSGLSMMFQEHGLDVRLSARLAERIRWKEGDTVAFGISPDGSIGVIYCDEPGTPLTPSQSELGNLEVSSYLALPTRFADYSTDWASVGYWISAGRIYFQMDQFETVDDQDCQEFDEPFDATAFDATSSLIDKPVFHGILAGALAVATLSLLGRLLW